MKELENSLEELGGKTNQFGRKKNVKNVKEPERTVNQMKINWE